MALTGSLLLPRELGIHTDYGHNNQHKGVVGKGSLHLFRSTLSSCTSRQDAWSHHILNGVRGSKSSQSSRYNVFQHRSFLVRSGGNGIPVLKTAAAALTKYKCVYVFQFNF
ncbi:hypothetical protein U1Q18_016521 [Sarracenia purpurea var. burkii]